MRSASPDEDIEDSLLEQNYARSKRRIAVLEDELANLKNAGAKAKSESQTFAQLGRGISRLVTLFDSVENLVKENDRRLDLEQEASGDNVVDVPPPTAEEEHRYRAYKELIRHIPVVKKKVDDLDPTEISQMYKALRKGADAARGDDTALLKKLVVNWMLQLFDAPNPPLDAETKADRGLEHNDTGRLLCPCEFDWEDEVVRQKIRDGDPAFIVSAGSYPRFVYANCHYDSTDIEKGLFQSKLLLKAYKAIFTSPSSAKSVTREANENEPPPSKRQKNSPTRRHVAALLNMTAVTPRSIAYAAVQLRFALSHLSSWSELDGDFSYSDFYNMIVHYFEENLGPQAKARTEKLLKWWTSEVFGRKPTAARAPVHVGTVQLLAQQRLARENASGDTTT